MTTFSSSCAEELRARDLLPEHTVSVYLAGSIVRGWGNEGSDLDVYVIVPQRWHSTTALPVTMPLTPDTVPLEICYVDGRRWEVTYWLESQVDQLLARVAPRDPEDGPAKGTLAVPEYSFLERLTYAEPVLGADWLASRRAEVLGSALRAMLVAQHLDSLDNQTEDAAGMLAAGDLVSAVLAARNAFGYAVDALLAASGEFGYGPKWRARRMIQAAPAVLAFDDYWALETMRGFDQETPGAWVEEVLRACQDITMDISI